MAAIAISPGVRAPAAAPCAPAPSVPFGEVLRRASAPRPPTPPSPPALAPLRAVEQARSRLDHALAQARAGRTFSAQELLALQSDAYRYQQAVDVAAKVAEAGAQSVRQAVNTQV